MRQLRSFCGASLAIALMSALAPTARADHDIDIERNRVVPVRLDDDLSVRNSRQGERFTATVEDNRDLPRGTKLMGRVSAVHRRSDVQPAHLELVFDRMALPDGTRRDIRAVPVSLDGNVVRRDRDGRYYGTDRVIDRDKAILGGALAGIVLGSIVKKPIEGAIIGAVAGVVIAQNQDSLADTAVLRRGTRMGALFQREVRFQYAGSDRWESGWDREGYDDRDDDWRNDPGEWDRYDDDRDDRDRYDEDGYDDDRYRDDRDWDERSSSDPYGWSNRATRITYMGRELKFSNSARPFRSGRTLMVPLNRTADQLDLEVSRRNQTTYVLTDSDSNLRLEQGSRSYRLNGRYGTMAVRMQQRNGITYVPLEVLVQLKRDPVYLNGVRVRIQD